MSGRGSDVAFWTGVLLSAIAFVFWTGQHRAERERAVELEAEIAETRKEIGRLSVVARNPMELERERRNLRAQLDMLGAILPAEQAQAEESLARALGRRGLQLARTERLNAEYAGYRRYYRVDLRLQLEAAGGSWLPGLARLDTIPTLFQTRRLEVIDPRNPDASALLDLRLTLGK